MKISRLSTLAALAYVAVAAIASPARAQPIVNLTSDTGVGYIEDIGESLEVTTALFFTGDPGGSISIAAFHLTLLSGNATFDDFQAAVLFALLPPPTSGDVILFADPSVSGPEPISLVTYNVTRTGPGDIIVALTPVQGVPMQGDCTLWFLGGDYIISSIPTPGSATLFFMATAVCARRRR